MTVAIWPPIDNKKFDSKMQVNSYFSWFFGHLFDEIFIPFSNNFTDKQCENEDISLASISDYNKIKYVSSQEVIMKIDYYLVLEKNLEKEPLDVKVKRMDGSIKVEGLFEEEDASLPKYYYIGTPKKDSQDAYHCVTFTYWFYGGINHDFLEKSRSKLLALKRKSSLKEKVSVFGTGPSLAESLEKKYENSFNIVCNTIIKNKNFCAKAGIDLIFATDAHFHFSYHPYTARFISDLTYAIKKYNATFFTFDKFGLFLSYRIPELAPNIYGIPAGRSEYGFNLEDEYAVFPGESVVNMFMLPFAMYLGNNIEMHGFTGRSPNDSYFWNHSDKHQYTDLMPVVRSMHPAFFENRDYMKYSDKVDEQINTRIHLGRSRFNKDIRSCTTSFYKCFEKSE